MKPARPLEFPTATAEQWEAAFRNVEKAYSRNASRRWVLVILRDHLNMEVNKEAED